MNFYLTRKFCSLTLCSFSLLSTLFAPFSLFPASLFSKFSLPTLTRESHEPFRTGHVSHVHMHDSVLVVKAAHRIETRSRKERVRREKNNLRKGRRGIHGCILVTDEWSVLCVNGRERSNSK